MVAHKYHISFDVETNEDKMYLEYQLRKQFGATSIFIKEKQEILNKSVKGS